MNEKNSVDTQSHSEDSYDQYSDRFKNKSYADSYHHSVNTHLFSYLRLKNKISLRQFLAGWLTSVMEMRAINRILRMCSGKSLVDVPCGTGKLLPLLIGSEKSILALDASSAMLSIARNLNVKGAQLALSDIRYLPIKDNSVDIVISNRFLHRIPPNKYSDTLGELYRISRKHVILYFSVKNYFTDFIISFENYFNIGDRGIIYYITKPEINKEVEQCGFHLVRGIHVLPVFSSGYLVLLEKQNYENEG